MDHFLYRDGILHAEDVPVPTVAAAVGTPFYCYSSATFTRHFKLFDEALSGLDHLVCYSMKSNSNQAILKLLGGLGAGMDVVSGGEYARARAAGIPGGPHRLFRRRQDQARNGRRAHRRHPPVQRGIRA